MAQLHRIAAVADIPPGTGRELTVAGRIVALFNVDGEFHALDGVCPHAGGPLGQGTLNGTTVTCPWHGWQFNVTTGQHCLSASIRTEGFAVKVDGDDVYVEIP
jgi:nitrite reductase (NADH) small subunit